MKEQVKDMFAKVTMPEETEKKIRGAMAQQPDMPRRRTVWKQAASLAALVVLVIALSPTARAAVNGWVVKYFWPDSDITIYERTDENGNLVEITGVATETPSFAQIIDGRLYFLGNCEKIDITDQITEEKPFYYTYTDDYGLTHAMVVGYSGTIENFGIYEFIWKEVDGTRDWTTGTGRNFLSAETETRYPWVEIVWEDLDIPWPMPE